MTYTYNGKEVIRKINDLLIMKVYIAKDWTGSHVFAEPPVLMKCGGMPDIWSGYKLPFQLADDIEIPRGQYLERNVRWTIINIIK